MLKHKAYKFRIYPNKEQQILINRTIGCSRFVFNHFLSKWNESYNETKKRNVVWKMFCRIAFI